MPDLSSHPVDPDDEQRHLPGTETLWNESYYLDFVAEDGAVAGYARIGIYPNLGVTWWTTMIVGPGRPVIASVAYDLPVGEGTGLVLEAQGYDITCSVEEPLDVMTLRGTAPAVGYAEPSAVYRGEAGDPTSVGFDLSWTTDGVPYHYEITTRYEVPCLVRGTVTVGGEVLAVEGHGQRDHSWGVRDWWDFGWCWMAARLDDGTRVHAADIRIPGHPVVFGYVQRPDGEAHPVEVLEMTEVLGDEGLPSTGLIRIGPGSLELGIHPLAFGPLLLVAPDGRSTRFARAVARFTCRDGRAGTGWIEWNQPDLPVTAR